MASSPPLSKNQKTWGRTGGEVFGQNIGPHSLNATVLQKKCDCSSMHFEFFYFFDYLSACSCAFTEHKQHWALQGVQASVTVASHSSWQTERGTEYSRAICSTASLHSQTGFTGTIKKRPPALITSPTTPSVQLLKYLLLP